ncbi:MAG: Ribonuclease HII [Candidatus Omnitrophica bacterium ADurb.Bin277]|nr:MAG: Ribonuclease HII [Candidatus Omnitrophica bacterium ADurb.Bin277]
MSLPGQSTRKALAEARLTELLRFDGEERRPGQSWLAGVDEAGRGPLAGPVVAAAVILGPTEDLAGLNDSKKMSRPQREGLFSKLSRTALIGIGLVDESLIDAINIYEATRLAMKRAVMALPHTPDCLLIDGPIKLDLPVLQKGIAGGDRKSASIAAASIVAKVFRDRKMEELHAFYPAYAFDKHKGYGTPDHLEALKVFGPCPAHRRSFSPVEAAVRETAGSFSS